MNPSMPPHVQPMNPAIPTQSMPLPIINAPRKVLINPNFKGGVQAATSKALFPLFLHLLFVLFEFIEVFVQSISLTFRVNVNFNSDFRIIF